MSFETEIDDVRRLYRLALAETDRPNPDEVRAKIAKLKALSATRNKQPAESELRALLADGSASAQHAIRVLDISAAELPPPPPPASWQASSLTEILRSLTTVPKPIRALERLRKVAERAEANLLLVGRPVESAQYMLALRLALICIQHDEPLLKTNGALNRNSLLVTVLRQELHHNTGTEKLARWALRKVGFLPQKSA
jgi:hypothetical protein